MCTDVTLSITPPSCHRQDTDRRQINHGVHKSNEIQTTSSMMSTYRFKQIHKQKSQFISCVTNPPCLPAAAYFRAACVWVLLPCPVHHKIPRMTCGLNHIRDHTSRRITVFVYTVLFHTLICLRTITCFELAVKNTVKSGSQRDK